MIKIIHIADTHLGYRQYFSDIRKKDFFNSFEFIINEAIIHNVDAIVHAGDLFNSKNPTLDDIIQTIKILQKLKINNIPFLCIVGNHEIKENNQWIDLLEQMNLSIKLTHEPFKLIDENLKINIYGIDYFSKFKFQNILFEKYLLDKEANYNILVMHLLLSPLIINSTISYLDILKKINIDFDLLLLGDSHKNDCKILTYFSNINGIKKKCYLTYSGSTERCSSSEVQKRYYNFITFQSTGINIEKKEIPTRDFIFITILCKKNDNFEKINSYIAKEIINKKEKILNSIIFLKLIGNNNILINKNLIEEIFIDHGACIINIIDQRTEYYENIQKVTYNNISFQNLKEIIFNLLKKININSCCQLINKEILNINISKNQLNDNIENILFDSINNNSLMKNYENKALNTKKF